VFNIKIAIEHHVNEGSCTAGGIKKRGNKDLIKSQGIYD